MARKASRNTPRVGLMLVLGIASMALITAACNTVKGVGEDIQSAGQAGEDAIN